MSKIREFPIGNGMVEITIARRRWWKRNKNGILYGSLMAPPFLALLLIDIFAKHPKIALAYLLGVGAWYLAFIFANAKKKPRAATRGRKKSSGKHSSFATYYITRDGEIAREEAS